MADPEVVNITIVEPADEVVEIAIDEVNGDAGYTPVKNVDYFDGHTPTKGVDYFDGAKGDSFIYSDFTQDQLDALKVKGDKGDPGTPETQMSLFLKLGRATDQSDGFLSHEDHILFSNKQPAGAYLTDTNVFRGTYIYHLQGSGDRVGDWRTYSDVNGFYVQYCTVANATRGNGTWVTKHTITI